MDSRARIYKVPGNIYLSLYLFSWEKLHGDTQLHLSPTLVHTTAVIEVDALTDAGSATPFAGLAAEQA